MTISCPLLLDIQKFQLQVASEDNEQLLAYYEGMFAANNENTMELERMKEERLRDSKVPLACSIDS